MCGSCTQAAAQWAWSLCFKASHCSCHLSSFRTHRWLLNFCLHNPRQVGLSMLSAGVFCKSVGGKAQCRCRVQWVPEPSSNSHPGSTEHTVPEKSEHLAPRSTQFIKRRWLKSTACLSKCKTSKVISLETPTSFSFFFCGLASSSKNWRCESKEETNL